MQKILVTGAAGFIGHNLSKRLLEAGRTVVGLDNLNDYYDVQLKRDRLKLISDFDTFTFIEMDISDRDAMKELFEEQKFQRVFNSAAQAGVRGHEPGERPGVLRRRHDRGAAQCAREGPRDPCRRTDILLRLQGPEP